MLKIRPARTIDLLNPFHTDLTGMCELVLVRHGEQQLDGTLTTSETVDPPLSELGLRQAAAVAERLSTQRVDAVYSSPHQRALVTGAGIAAEHGLSPIVRPELVEFEPWQQLPGDKSIHDLLTRQEITGIFREHGRTAKFSAFPYGEDRTAFRSRIVGVLDEIMAAHVGERVVVTCHSGVINALLAQVFQTDQDVLIRLHHTSITIARGAEERRSVLTVNDFAHVLPFQDTIGAANL